MQAHKPGHKTNLQKSLLFPQRFLNTSNFGGQKRYSEIPEKGYFDNKSVGTMRADTVTLAAIH